MSSGGEVSEDARILERVVQDCLLDCGEDEADVGGIGGLCQTAAVMSMVDETGQGRQKRKKNSLRIQVQVCSVDLVKPPEQILGRLVDVVPSRVVGKVVAQR